MNCLAGTCVHLLKLQERLKQAVSEVFILNVLWSQRQLNKIPMTMTWMAEGHDNVE